MQILLAPENLPGPAAEGAASLDPLAAEGDVLEDFLARLQAIVRQARAEAPGALDDTRLAGRRSRS